jgi:hypothetical protein
MFTWQRSIIIVTATAIFLEKLEPESTEITGWNEMKTPRTSRYDYSASGSLIALATFMSQARQLIWRTRKEIQVNR